MKKIKNDGSEVVTKKIFQEGIGELAILINKSFEGVCGSFRSPNSRHQAQEKSSFVKK